MVPLAKITRAALTCVAYAASATAASAQETRKPELDGYTPIGSHIEQDPTHLKGNDLHSFFDEMATCVVRRSADRADYFLRMSDDFGISDEIGSVTKFLPLPTCVGKAAGFNSVQSMARFTPRALRNWLSEKAYLASRDSFTPFDTEAQLVPRTYFSRGGLMRAQTFGAFADCMVAADAQKADALVRTGRGTPAEHSAAAALAPAMGACIPAGATFKLDPDTVRGLAAQGLWQRYEAPKPARYKGKS